ncbi:MAG: oxidoreductase [Pseudomonadota bacterium]
MAARRPFRLAVWKLASCDGCQLSLLDLEDELLQLPETVDIAYFLEASRTPIRGPYDISLVDGSIATPFDVKRIREIRRISRVLVAIGTCATSGGIQALRNFAKVKEYLAYVYPQPEHVAALQTSTGIRDNVPVDYELQGCPINKRQLLETILSYREGRVPAIPAHSVCVDCKLAGNVCVMVTGTPCMGPVTRAGCGALCPRYHRGCYSCYGPMETPNSASLVRAFRSAGATEPDLLRAFRMFYANAEAFRREAALHESEQQQQPPPQQPPQ